MKNSVDISSPDRYQLLLPAQAIRISKRIPIRIQKRIPIGIPTRIPIEFQKEFQLEKTAEFKNIFLPIFDSFSF